MVEMRNIGDSNKSRIMVVGAHPDDAEMNAGGSIHKWVSMGLDVCVVILASSPGTLRYTESVRACGRLGVTQVISLGGVDTDLHSSISALTRRLDKVVGVFKPDTVITHFHADTHQDHVTAYRVAQAAARKVPNFMMFKPTYPSGRPDIPFHPTVVSILPEDSIDAKVDAINEFTSQRSKYGDDDWAIAMEASSKGDAWTYGGFHGYAEVFQLSRLVV